MIAPNLISDSIKPLHMDDTGEQALIAMQEFNVSQLPVVDGKSYIGLATMEDYFKRRSRVMPPNNRKQAMLPSTAEVLDNPIGTACGFALDIGKARFFFTPGVPRWKAGAGEGWLTAEYAMLPRSTHTRSDREAARGKQSGRTQEIQRLIGRSLRAIIDLEKLPENVETIRNARLF